MPSINKSNSVSRKWFGVFVFLFIVAGVFMPRVSFADDLIYAQVGMGGGAHTQPATPYSFTATASGTVGSAVSYGTAQCSAYGSYDCYYYGYYVFYIATSTVNTYASVIAETAPSCRVYTYLYSDGTRPEDYGTGMLPNDPADPQYWYAYGGLEYGGGDCEIVAGNTYYVYPALKGVGSSPSYYTNTANTMPTLYLYSTTTPPETGSPVTAGTSSAVLPASPTAQTYLSNPINFYGIYTQADTYNQIVFDIVAVDVPVQLVRILNIPLVNGVDIPYSTTYNLPYQGNYTARAKLYDTVTGESSEWSSTVSFGLGTTTISTSTRGTLPGSPLPLDCGSLDIACHLKNAVVWLFYPSDDSTTQFSNLTLQNSFPFAYVYQIGDLRTELFSATSTATGTVSVAVPSPAGGTTTITFLSASMIESVPYASTIKTIIGWLLWLMMIEYVYYRVIRVHDSNTPK